MKKGIISAYNIISVAIAQTAYLDMYNLGVHLREAYAELLDDNPHMYEATKMRTTEHALSMLSAQLVNAGLWPPTEEQTWMLGFNWQPMPTG